MPISQSALRASKQNNCKVSLRQYVRLRFGTQKEFAKAIGQPETVVSAWLSRASSTPVRRITLIAEACGVSDEELFVAIDWRAY